MRCLVSLAVVFALAQSAAACGDGKGTGKHDLGGGFVTFSGGFAPRSLAGSTLVNTIHQKIAAQAAARRARRKPARIARYSQIRATKLAQRDARKEARIAAARAKQQEREEFLTQARTWTDSSGRYQVLAVLVGADRDSVRLKRECGRVVLVPLDKLSVSDRVVISQMHSGGKILLAAR